MTNNPPLADYIRPAARDWFGDAIKLFDSPLEDDPLEATAAAAGMWMGYALFGEAIECLGDATVDEKRKLRSDLAFAHHKATEFLMMEAEREGLNAAPLSEAKRVCQELFAPIRGHVTASTPYVVYWFHHPKCTSDHWPDCLGEWRYALPPAMQEAIREGEGVFVRLMVRLSINPEGGKPPAEDKQPANPIQAKGGTPPAGPFAPLSGWADIVAALNEHIGTRHFKNEDSTRDRIRKLNNEYDGPIVFLSGKGVQPQVDKTPLMKWWKKIQTHFDARNRKDESGAEAARLETADTHKYGATGIVVPGIGGSVKTKRATGKKEKEGKR